jgi:HEAT repeat protein
MRKQGKTVDDPQIVEALIELSRDPQPVLNQSAAFALGLFDSIEAIHQLEVLLESGDQITRVNATTGLARHNSTKCYGIIRDVLAADIIKESPNTKEAYFQQLVILTNVLKAVADLAPKFEKSQRDELTPLIEKIAKNHPESRIRLDATNALNSIRAVKD